MDTLSKDTISLSTVAFSSLSDRALRAQNEKNTVYKPTRYRLSDDKKRMIEDVEDDNEIIKGDFEYPSASPQCESGLVLICALFPTYYEPGRWLPMSTRHQDGLSWNRGQSCRDTLRLSVCYLIFISKSPSGANIVLSSTEDL